VTPPTDAWTVRSWWLPVPGEPASGDGFTVVDQAHTTWESARKQALSLACCRGAVGVVVYDLRGDVIGHWDRFSNVAHHLWGGDDKTTAMAELTQAAWNEEQEDRRGTALSVDGQRQADRRLDSPTP
jgi:hypothetical protein